MQRVVSAEEMRWSDQTAIRSYGIPSLFLMENAGVGVVNVIQSRYGPLQGKRILVVCGKGNNGGDGFVIARHLSNKGVRVDVLLVSAARSFSGDAKKNYGILRAISKRCPGMVALQAITPRMLQKISTPELIVDSIFGTGFTGKVKPPIKKVIDWINSCDVPVISVDIPSGVHGTTGVVENVAVKATITPTMGAMKSGLLCNEGSEHAGEIEIIDIGIPVSVFDDKRFKTQLVQASDVSTVLPKRSKLSHKYSVGKVFILAGARNYTGAAALCANAALKSGAGAVVLGVPESVYSVVAKKVIEPIVVPLPSTGEGTLGLASLDEIRKRMTWADVLVVGPGLSQHEETARLIVEILASGFERIVLDADGLNSVANQNVGFFKRSGSRFILTPHAGELSRIVKITSREIDLNRIEVARSSARKLGVTLALKGAPTVTASASGQVYMNSTGNPGMATVGSGDVLAGLIGGLWAQGMDEVAAAFGGVYVHGLSGDLASRELGERSIVASDLIAMTPDAFRQLGGIF